MKIFYDSNNFIKSAVSNETCVCTSHRENCLLDHYDLEVIEVDPEIYPGLTCVYYENYNNNVTLLDGYGLPLFKYADGQVVQVQDATEYQVDSAMWATYLERLGVEVAELITTSTNDELKTVYDASPQHKKDIIYKELEYAEARKINQVTFNLGTEIVLRALGEWFYIKEVEQRSPTADEIAGFHLLLQRTHDHALGMGMPMSETSWWQDYAHSLLDASDALRMETFAKRFYITGRP